jgi:hypothetical protein
MKFSKYILFITGYLNKKDINVGKVILQKILYFSLGEDRKNYFRAYLYGPYSDEVQWTIQSLINNGYLKTNGKTLQSGDMTISEKDDINFSRILNSIHFFEKNNLELNSQTVSVIAKVHMFFVDNQLKSDDELIRLIKDRSKFLGWKEVLDLSPADLVKYITYAKKMEYNMTHARAKGI